MTTINYEPQVGDTVSVQGHHGIFEVVQVHPCTDNGRLQPNWKFPQGHGWADLEEVKTKFRLENIPWTALYMEEIFAKRILEKLRAEGRFPESVLDFQVKSGADHEENPALYVTFAVKPDESRPAIQELSRFRQVVDASLRQEHLLQWWPYINFSGARSSMDAAS